MLFLELMELYKFMKHLRLGYLSVFFALLFSVSAFAQTTQNNKVFVIDTGAFADEKEGIKKFSDANKQVFDGLKQEYAELAKLARKIQDMKKEFQVLSEQFQKTPNGPISEASLQAKADEIANMEIDFKRKEEDLELKFAKRSQALIHPIRLDIYKEMNTFAKAKGYPIILDLVQLVESNLILAIGDEKVDLTKEFIQYYNSLPKTSAQK